MPKCNPEAGKGEQQQQLGCGWASASPELSRRFCPLQAQQELAEKVDDKRRWLHGVVLCKQVTEVLRICLAFGHEPKDSLKKERDLFSLYPGIQRNTLKLAPATKQNPSSSNSTLACSPITFTWKQNSREKCFWQGFPSCEKFLERKVEPDINSLPEPRASESLGRQTDLDGGFLHEGMWRTGLSQASHQNLQSKTPHKASPICPTSHPATTLTFIASPLHF